MWTLWWQMLGMQGGEMLEKNMNEVFPISKEVLKVADAHKKLKEERLEVDEAITNAIEKNTIENHKEVIQELFDESRSCINLIRAICKARATDFVVELLLHLKKLRDRKTID